MHVFLAKLGTVWFTLVKYIQWNRNLSGIWSELSLWHNTLCFYTFGKSMYKKWGLMLSYCFFLFVLSFNTSRFPCQGLLLLHKYFKEALNLQVRPSCFHFWKNNYLSQTTPVAVTWETAYNPIRPKGNKGKGSSALKCLLCLLLIWWLYHSAGIFQGIFFPLFHNSNWSYNLYCLDYTVLFIPISSICS